MADKDTIIADVDLAGYIKRAGITLTPKNGELHGLCPFHDDKHPSLRVNDDKARWYCDPCGFGGNVIDFAMKLNNVNFVEAMKMLTPDRPIPPPPRMSRPFGRKEVCHYDYHDEAGRCLYRVVRYENPKTFRQCRPNGPGWDWSMTGVRRVLYHLPDVIRSESVIIVEGEKDADTLIGLGFVATTNVGGAGKWLDAYSDVLADKDVSIIHDNDQPGRAHVEKVADSLVGTVRTLRVASAPSPHKDITDYVGTVQNPASVVTQLLASVPVRPRGMDVPVQRIADIAGQYADIIQASAKGGRRLDLAEWIPAWHNVIRPLLPGELVTVVADTGVGKSMILSNIAAHTTLPTLFFQLELPATLMYERIVAMAHNVPCHVVEHSAAVGQFYPDVLPHLFICDKSGLSMDDIEDIITKSELVIGEKPGVVMLDYLGLVKGRGSRYERISDAAERFKQLAKNHNFVGIAVSQVHRAKDGGDSQVYLHSAKDSGSVENSSGLVLGAWRDSECPNMLVLKVLKQTKGHAGRRVCCDVDWSCMSVRQIEGEDI